MASNTPNLSLYMKDPVADGNDFFDVETMMNDNWEKIDGFAGGMDEVKERLNTISRQDVTLNAGVQIINATKVAPFQLSGLTGRMLVNLLGRLGSCESVGLWSSNTTIAVDTANKTSGTSSFKLILGSVPATASATFLTTPGKKYIAVADVKNGNTSKIAISINGIAGAAGNDVSAASAFAPSVVRFAATDFFHIVTVTGTGNSGNTFNMDSVRVYEISEADYAAAATLTPAQVAAKWPYVDSVMPVRNPYAIRYGENLLSSFYEWEVSAAATGKVSITGSYSLIITPTTINNYVRYKAKVIPNTDYSWSIAHSGRVAVSDKNDTNLLVPYTANQTGSFNSGANEEVYFYVSNDTITTGTFTFSNPMLNIGSTARPFKPREDSMLALQTDLYADPVTGANADTVFERDGQYFKSKKWQGLTLDGNLAWVQGEGGATNGNRQVRLVGAATGAVAGSGIGVKFDGKILPQGSTGNTADTNAVTAAGDIYFGIPVANSGWADSYGPTSDEIKAYFLGWKMKQFGAGDNVPYTSGTKEWVQILNPVATNTTTLPTTQAPNWTPHRLVYQLATPIVEPIISEGQLTFTEGDNQVEVGTGIVLREAVGPKLHTNGFYYINANAVPGSNTVNPPRRIINIFANNKNDTSSWANYTNSSSNGITSELNPSKFNAAASYSVTYLMLYASPIAPFTGSYAANEKTLLSDLVDSVQQNTARVSVLENKKADKDNPAWLTPTLINGVTAETSSVDTQPQYLKMSDNLIKMHGSIKVPTSNETVTFFKLPEGYRPKILTVLNCPASDAVSSDKIAVIAISPDGRVEVVGRGGYGWIRLDAVQFIAEV